MTVEEGQAGRHVCRNGAPVPEPAKLARLAMLALIVFADEVLQAAVGQVLGHAQHLAGPAAVTIQAHGTIWKQPSRCANGIAHEG